MKELTIVATHLSEAPRIEDIRSFEAEQAIVLPGDLIEFLIVNRARLAKEDVIDEFVVDSWYSWSEVVRRYKSNLEIMEGKYVAFATTNGHIQWVVSLGKKDYGKVYLYDMEDVSFIVNDQKLLIANSFTEFINDLEDGSHEEL